MAIVYTYISIIWFARGVATRLTHLAETQAAGALYNKL